MPGFFISAESYFSFHFPLGLSVPQGQFGLYKAI